MTAGRGITSGSSRCWPKSSVGNALRGVPGAPQTEAVGNALRGVLDAPPMEGREVRSIQRHRNLEKTILPPRIDDPGVRPLPPICDQAFADGIVEGVLRDFH